MIEIRRIDAAHGADARLKNEAFQLWGRVIPALKDGAWSWRVEPLPEPREERYPDMAYDPGADDAVFLGAYEEGSCVGLAVLRREMFRYLYLEDLKVRAASRGRGVGGQLIEACMAEAARQGLRGVYTVGQDDNASACLFYLVHGFAIGGFDNRSYGGTSQAGRANLFFYRDCDTV